jgi:hypothetical protein
MSKVIRTNPLLWNIVKDELYRSDKGGEPYTWSARKSQFAVKEYKKRGGEYINPKPKTNPLITWTKEDWDYITPNSKRYLPKKVRDKLTSNEKRIETILKGDNLGEYIPYSKTVLEKMRKR